jgi:2-polyprenyl-3-methyl-5-hydroxy-6-metoxy-1,4-benzoquinol methylase
MSVKEHYDTHLGNFYSWMTGDFEEKKNDFLSFCEKSGIKPFASKNALDLGAGNGIQSIALAELDFHVKAIDFNQQLLTELRYRKNELPVEIIQEDIRAVSAYGDCKPELIICCGDTLSHLNSMEEISRLIKDSFTILIPEGKLILSFRDYSAELKDSSRFIPVKINADRILTCFLEYFPDKVRVTDILHEKEDGNWQQKISSYEKVRVSENTVLNILQDTGFNIRFKGTHNRMLTIIGQKSSDRILSLD